jgi:hypothetical protein
MRRIIAEQLSRQVARSNEDRRRIGHWWASHQWHSPLTRTSRLPVPPALPSARVDPAVAAGSPRGPHVRMDVAGAQAGSRAGAVQQVPLRPERPRRRRQVPRVRRRPGPEVTAGPDTSHPPIHVPRRSRATASRLKIVVVPGFRPAATRPPASLPLGAARAAPHARGTPVPRTERGTDRWTSSRLTWMRR